jgi:hypothetical protein
MPATNFYDHLSLEEWEGKVLSQLEEIYYCSDVNTAGSIKFDIHVPASVVQIVTFLPSMFRNR